MYETTWSNVTRAEDAIWKGMAAYTAVFAGLALATSVIGSWGFLIIVVLFGLFGMALSQNANLWFVRNMGMISNLEAEFLNKTDYGSILPADWRGKKVPYLNHEMWTIMTVFFFIVSLASIFAVGSHLAVHEFAITFLVFVSGLLLVCGYACILHESHSKFVFGAPGKP